MVVDPWNFSYPQVNTVVHIFNRSQLPPSGHSPILALNQISLLLMQQQPILFDIKSSETTGLTIQKIIKPSKRTSRPFTSSSNPHLVRLLQERLGIPLLASLSQRCSNLCSSSKNYTELHQRIYAPLTAGTKIYDHVTIHTKIHLVRPVQNQFLSMETQVYLMHASISKVQAVQDVKDQWMKATPAFAGQTLPSLVAALIAANNADVILISAPTTSSIGYSAAVAADTITIPAEEAAAYSAFKAQDCGGRNQSGRGDRDHERDPIPSMRMLRLESHQRCWQQ